MLPLNDTLQLADGGRAQNKTNENQEAVLIFFRAYLSGIFEDDFSVEGTRIAGYRGERKKNQTKKPLKEAEKEKKLKKSKQLLN